MKELEKNELMAVDGGNIFAIIAAVAIVAWGVGNLVHDCIINHEQLDLTEW